MGFDHDGWLAIAREAAAAAGAAVDRHPPHLREEFTGTVGAGGDRSLAIDVDAESAIIEVLRRHAEAGLKCTVVSEEIGEVDLGAPLPRLLIDPIDGSLNAGRGPGHHAVSIAIGSGPSIADVEVGYVYDLSTDQEWWAIRGGGAFLDGRRLTSQTERRKADGRLELVGVEAADPKLLALAMPVLTEEVARLRALGAIALTLCHLAAGAIDAMLTLGYCRPVDAAAAQLLVRETGGVLQWNPGQPLSEIGLDTDQRSALVAARTPETLAALRPAVAHLTLD